MGVYIHMVFVVTLTTICSCGGTMKKRTTVAISLLVILFLLPAWAQAEREKGDSITWFILDLPPFL
ncbi:MAG: hypothetical protein E3J94_03335 [Desulfobacteraceae bacterium]|nr:MAG: hypothetical protein E3J94_03335 [Desulfobacteraceae bacterium]